MSFPYRQSPSGPSANIGAKGFINANQTIATGVHVPVVWDVLDYDFGNLLTAGTSAFQIRERGVYVLSSSLVYATSGAGVTRRVRGLKNGADIVFMSSSPPETTEVAARNGGGVVLLDAGDTIEFEAYQDSGAPLDIQFAVIGPERTFGAVQRIA